MRLLPNWNWRGDKQVKIPWSTDNARMVSETKAAIPDTLSLNRFYKKHCGASFAESAPAPEAWFQPIPSFFTEYYRQNNWSSPFFRDFLRCGAFRNLYARVQLL